MKSWIWLAFVIVSIGGAATGASGQTAAAGPVIVFDTVKGAFQVELYPNEAPKSVAHILALVRRNFYNGLRVHRLVSGFVVQFGDPQTRDMTKRPLWGNGGSGRDIGVLEANPKRPHRLGAVALARQAEIPGSSDSQLYVALAGPDSPQIKAINGKYTVVGQVIAGMDVVSKLQVPDVIRRATVKEAKPAAK